MISVIKASSQKKLSEVTCFGIIIKSPLSVKFAINDSEIKPIKNRIKFVTLETNNLNVILAINVSMKNVCYKFTRKFTQAKFKIKRCFANVSKL